jgi:hypothetical protein
MESISRSGRPPLITIPQCNYLKQTVTNDTTKNHRLCAAGVQQLWKKKFGQDVSTRTIRRTLHSVGLKRCVTRKKPLISPANVEARLAWCLDYQSWTKADWSKVMWSDESTFSQFQQSRFSRVWWEPEEEWDLSCISATVKHSSSRIYWVVFQERVSGRLFHCLEQQLVTHMSPFFVSMLYQPWKKHFQIIMAGFKRIMPDHTNRKLQWLFKRKIAFVRYLGQLKVLISIQLRIFGLKLKKIFAHIKNCHLISLNLTNMLKKRGKKFQSILSKI